MLRQTIVVLGIGALAIGLTPIANAQSTTPSSSENGSVTLSGESLQTIENRSLSSDYPTFFNGASPDTQGNSARPSQTVNVGRLRRSTPQKSPLDGVLNENVDVVVGDTLNPSLPLTSFPNSGDAGDNDRVRLQLQLGQ